jgi:hypothetical protein
MQNKYPYYRFIAHIMIFNSEIIRHCSEKSMAWGGLFLSFSRPSQDQQKSCLSAAGGFNYDAPLHGASRPKSVAQSTAGDTEASDKALVERGFFVNHSRVLVGSGTTTFNHAKSALLSWK